MLFAGGKGNGTFFVNLMDALSVLSEDKIFEQLDKKLEELKSFEEKLKKIMQ